MEEWMEAKQFRRSERRQILMVKWKMRWKKLLTIFIAYILIVLFALLPKISSIVYLCIETDTLCQLQINCHFHFINFPTVSSLLHIGKILVHWLFLEISGPQKWVVGATLALKQKFLAGTLEFKISWCNLLPSRHVLGMCELSLKSKPFLVVISFNLLLTSRNFVDALRSSLCPSSFSLRLMPMPCCYKNSIVFVWPKKLLYIIFDQVFCSKAFSLFPGMKYHSFSTFGNSRDLVFPFDIHWSKKAHFGQEDDPTIPYASISSGLCWSVSLMFIGGWS